MRARRTYNCSLAGYGKQCPLDWAGATKDNNPNVASMEMPSASRRVAEASERHSAMKRMRILLQQKETGMYFRDVGLWVPNAAEAMDFVSSTAAIDFCTANRLGGVQLVLKFTEEKCDIVLPVVAAQAGRVSRPNQVS